MAVDVKIELNRKQRRAFEKILDRLQKLGNNISEPITKAAQYMLGSVMRNFQEEGRPDTWKEWSKRYRLWREAIGKPRGILMLDANVGTKVYGGDLRKGIHTVPPNKEGVLLATGANAPYAALHQFGGKNGQGANVDPRPFLLFQDEDVDKIQGFFVDAIDKEMKK